MATENTNGQETNTQDEKGKRVCQVQVTFNSESVDEATAILKAIETAIPPTINAHVGFAMSQGGTVRPMMRR